MKASTSVILVAFIISQVSLVSCTFDAHERVARAMAMVNAYSVGSLKKCTAIGNNAPFCGVKYPVPEYAQIDGKILDNAAQAIVNGIKNNPKLKATAACIHDVKGLYCNVMFPRCDAQRNEITFNTSNCINSDVKCPASVHNYIKKTHICDFIPKGSFYLDDCIKPPNYRYQTCPNAPSGVLIPKFLAANPILQDTTATNFKQYLKSQKISDHCIQVAMQLECGAIPFCSPNKTLLLSTITQRVCQNFYNCLPAATQATLKTRFNCNLYPNEKTGTHIRLPLNEVYLAGAYANRPNILMVACIVFLTSIMRILTIS